MKTHRIITLALSLAALPALANPRSQAPSTAARGAQQTTAQQTTARRPAPRVPALRPPTTPVARPAPAPQPASAVAPAPPAQVVHPPPASPNGALTADEVARRIQDFYDRTTSFQANFTQASRNRLYGDERRTGRVIFRKPGRMRWNYDAPSGDLIVSNGTTLWAYQAEERQAVQQALTQSQMPTALAFLTGVGRLTDSFTFRLLDANQFQYPNGYVLELRPTTPQPSYERIVFYVDRATFQVARTAVIDAQGNTNRFDFNAPQVNLTFPDTVFNWTPPAGTSIVRP